jgi:phospholipid transport system substrate-binding protein
MAKPNFARVPVLLLTLALLTGADGGKPPDQEVREATDQLQSLIRQNYDDYKKHPDKFYAMVDKIVVPHFDQKYIGQIVLGRAWRSASEPQRARFVAAFKNSLVHSYADALLENYNTVKAVWKPVHLAADASDATVNAELQRQQGPPIQLGFSVHRVDNDWKIYDVVVDGVSLAANFRSQFAAEIKGKGIDGLTQRLESGGKTLQDEGALSGKGKSGS